MIENAYIHIPFCRQKCYYCSFVSYTNIALKSNYINALVRQIKEEYNNSKLKTIYFGGGTPSLLDISELQTILKSLNFGSDSEVTLEANPENLQADYLSKLLDIGVNRLSLGIQSLDDRTLNSIGRKHSSNEAIKAIKSAQKVGFDNINIDLIYGLPGQSNSLFVETLKRIAELNIQHVSLYGLKIDEDCFFAKKMPQELPNEDDQAEMYLYAIDFLTSRKFNHYEISNFSIEGFESRHNLNYWDNNTYYGFGAAASGYSKDTRYTNILNLKDYISDPFGKEIEYKVSPNEKLEEEIFLGLRKTSGININEINKKYNIDFENKYNKIIDRFSSTNHLKKTDYGFKLSTEGILLSNSILAEFLD